MANLVMGAMSSIIPKLYQLLQEEYSLQTHVKERISNLMLELEIAQAALAKVAEVPWDQLDKPVQIWARLVREASYDMEDVLDTFLVHVKGPNSTEEKQSLLKYIKKITNFLKKSKDRRKISGDVTDIMTHLQEVTEQCCRYKVHDIVARRATASTIDPRLAAMYTQVKNLVGMDKSSSDLISMLHNSKHGDISGMKMKIVSIVGVGGLGKTTLAKAVYDKIKGDFNCAAFVPVGRNPNLKKIFNDILIDLDVEDLEKIFHKLDERQLINQLRKFFLQSKKRFLIVIDDIWEIKSWETIKLAIDDDKNCGGRIIMTTRNMEVATKANEVYKLQALPYDSSIELLYARIYGHEGRHVDSQPDGISDKFIRKCGGIPLAIITMASLLASKQREEWPELYNTIDFKEVGNTMTILSFSYYDLPAHLRTCLLYLSAFPEDSIINKDSLVWMWVAEGFVHKKDRMRLFEIGEGYFNDLINRSMIQAEESNDDGTIIGCRVHDMVLDFIRFMSQEENFFTALDSNQDRVLQGNVRRLANHKRTIVGHTHQANLLEMPKLRSFIGIGCDIEMWTPLSSFALLRVLAIESYLPRDGSCFDIKDLGHLLHLRFLSLRGTQIGRIPKEIGALRFLQTLDLWESDISELPSSFSLLKRLACLRISFDGDAIDGKVFSLEGMTSLEELSINLWMCKTKRWHVKDLGCLKELRVLRACIFCDKETKTDLLESLRHLEKLQNLKICTDVVYSREGSKWQPTELVLQSHLRHLAVHTIEFCKLPSCINSSCQPTLSHLDLKLQAANEEDLKILGRLPELRFLRLEMWSSSATISNISDRDTCYFPKLRCFRLKWSIVLFVANKEDKQSVSFHIWNGEDDIGIMPYVSDDELHRPRLPVSDQKLNSDDDLQSPMLSVSDDDELQRRPLQKLQHGLAAVVFYLLAVFQFVLAFLKRWSPPKVDQYPSISNRGPAPGNGNGEHPAAMPSVSDDENKQSIYSKGAAAPPHFMPSLQVLDFYVRDKAIEDHPKCCDNLRLEYLSSLREINVNIFF